MSLVYTDPDYHTSPDISDWVWITTSVILASIGFFGLVSNLNIVIAYAKNSTVRHGVILNIWFDQHLNTFWLLTSFTLVASLCIVLYLVARWVYQVVDEYDICGVDKGILWSSDQFHSINSTRLEDGTNHVQCFWIRFNVTRYAIILIAINSHNKHYYLKTS